MPKAPHEQDLNEDAATVVRFATGADAPLPSGLEAAWEAWAKCIHGVDERTWTLLRAAFEAGADSARGN